MAWYQDQRQSIAIRSYDSEKAAGWDAHAARSYGWVSENVTGTTGRRTTSVLGLFLALPLILVALAVGAAILGPLGAIIGGVLAMALVSPLVSRPGRQRITVTYLRQG